MGIVVIVCEPDDYVILDSDPDMKIKSDKLKKRSKRKVK